MIVLMESLRSMGSINRAHFPSKTKLANLNMTTLVMMMVMVVVVMNNNYINAYLSKRSIGHRGEPVARFGVEGS
ncbi:ABC transporter permease protein [Anopheles sinensis]|uniref:ABC transporter permease protein n=1 Tax=Anopheles sinensis TaxID=74873 RepID=A0A084W8I0_ANOSI|nr:ABC transporter permease protein [Anopheles sinensis]